MQVFLENPSLYVQSVWVKMLRLLCSLQLQPKKKKKQNLVDRWKMGSAQLGENDEVRRKRLFWVSNLGSSGFYQHYGTAASSDFHEPLAESTQNSALQGKVWVETQSLLLSFLIQESQGCFFSSFLIGLQLEVTPGAWVQYYGSQSSKNDLKEVLKCRWC